MKKLGLFEPKRTALVLIKEQNTNTKGADIRSLFRRIANRNREQNNELQREIESEEYSIIVTD